MEAPAAPRSAAAIRDSTLQEALAALFALASDTLQAQRCSLYLRSDDGHSLELRRQVGLPSGDGLARVSMDGTVMGLVMRSRLALLVEDIAAHPLLPVHPDRYSTVSFLSVPILVENEAIAVFNATERRDGRPFAEQELRWAELLVGAIGAVRQHDVMVQRVLSASEIDAVTGLYNGRTFAKRLAQEVERAQRAHRPLTLLVLDVRDYGDLAGRVGVQAAGLLMRCIGEMVARVVRQSDILARCTDDAIAIVLPDTSLDNARRVARTIAREVAHDKLPAHLRYEVETLRTHLGIASLGPNMSSDDLLQQATEALAEPSVQGHFMVAVGAGGVPRDGPRRARLRATHQRAIATALRLGIPYLASPADAASPQAAGLISVAMARTYLCFPVAFEAGTLTLAMADPADAAAIQAVSLATNMAVFPVASPRERILQAIATLM